MKIETKYDIGQEVWFKGYKNLPFVDRIFEIKITVGHNDKVDIKYDLWGDVLVEEGNLFRTKQELLDSL